MTQNPGAGTAPGAVQDDFSPRKWRVLLVLVGLLALGVHARGLDNGWVFDDHSLIVENDKLGDWSNVPHLFRAAWRPLKRLSFMVDHALWGLDPFGFHLTNLLFHAGAVMASAVGLAALGVRRRTSLLAAAFLAAHPMTVESVAVITHRKELMGTLFLCLALAAHARARPTVLSAIATWGFFLASILSKEVVGATFPLLAFAHDLLLRDGSWKRNLRRSLVVLGPLGVGVLAVLFLRLAYQEKPTLLPFFTAAHISELTSGAATTYPPVLASAARAFWYDLGLLAAPWSPCADHPFQLSTSLFTAQGLLALGGWLGVGALPFLLRRRAPALALASAWLFLTLLPVTNVLPLSQWFVAERFLYAPAVGAMLGLAALLARLGAVPLVARRMPWLEGTLAAVLVALLAGRTLQRTVDWRDDLAIWSATAAQVPDSILANRGLGNAFQQAGRLEEAGNAYLRVLERVPDEATSLTNGGDALMRVGRIAEATALLERAAVIQPSAADVRNNLGNCYKMQGRVDEAWRQHLLAVRLDPQLAEPRVNLATTLVQRGDLDGAVHWLEEALRVEPDLAVAHLNLGLVRARRGEVELARVHLRRVLQLGAPEDWKASARRKLAELDAPTAAGLSAPGR